MKKIIGYLFIIALVAGVTFLRVRFFSLEKEKQKSDKQVVLKMLRELQATTKNLEGSQKDLAKKLRDAKETEKLLLSRLGEEQIRNSNHTDKSSRQNREAEKLRQEINRYKAENRKITDRLDALSRIYNEFKSEDDTRNIIAAESLIRTRSVKRSIKDMPSRKHATSLGTIIIGK